MPLWQTGFLSLYREECRYMPQKVRKAIFPVGGLGTRFLPATKAMPKEMLPVVDKPLIQYAVEEAQAAGIEDFIFVTGRGKHAIEDCVTDRGGARVVQVRACGQDASRYRPDIGGGVRGR